jgi:DNA-binding MarR family transcriptional regulator
MTSRPEAEPLDLIHLISGVNRQMEKAIEARLKPSGVAIERYRVLAALSLKDGRSMGDLAAQVFVDLPTLTKIIDRMVANAEVYRSPDANDRRRVLIFISERGQETFRTLRGLLQPNDETLIGSLDARQAQQLRTLLTNLLNRE